MGSFDTALFETFAGDGVVHTRSSSSIDPADEAEMDDGIDANCNRRDN